MQVCGASVKGLNFDRHSCAMIIPELIMMMILPDMCSMIADVSKCRRQIVCRCVCCQKWLGCSFNVECSPWHSFSEPLQAWMEELRRFFTDPPQCTAEGIRRTPSGDAHWDDEKDTYLQLKSGAQ